MGDLNDLAGVLPGEFDLEVRQQDGFDQVDVRWTDRQAHARMHVYPDRVYWQMLNAPPRGRLYSDLCEVLPQWLKGQGIEAMECRPGDDTAREALMRRGEWRDAKVECSVGTFVDGLRWEL